MEHLEGRQSVLAALHAGQRTFRAILIRHGIHVEKVAELLKIAAARDVPVRYSETAELNALAHGTTHGGVVAVCSPKPRTTIEQLLALLDGLREPPLLLLLEGIDDARNLGFTLRTADAFGVHAVLIKKHLWDLDPVEIARPASGAYERLPLVQVDELAGLAGLRRRGVRLIGCLGNAKRSMYEADLAGPVCLAVGGEKRGLSGALRGICDAFASIPTRPGATSLALSHAASVLLAEALRQRRQT